MTRRILLAILAAVTAAAAALAPAGPAAAGDSITPTTPIPRLPYSFTNFLSGTGLEILQSRPSDAFRHVGAQNGFENGGQADRFPLHRRRRRHRGPRSEGAPGGDRPEPAGE